jgi:hypothetical protein
LAERLADAGVDRDVRGQEGASDHAPAWARLDGSTVRRSRQARRSPRRPAANVLKSHARRPSFSSVTPGI